MTVGARLREERDRLQWPAGTFAEACSVTRKSQFNFETDANLPGGAYLIAAAQLGVDVRYVLTGERPQLAPVDATVLAGLAVQIELALTRVSNLNAADKELAHRRATLLAAAYNALAAAAEGTSKAAIIEQVRETESGQRPKTR